MKFSAILLFCASLMASASGKGQLVTLNLKNASLEMVFEEIGKQTGYNFLYTDQMLHHANRVDLSVKNMPLKDALNLCFKDQQLGFSILNKTIIVRIIVDSDKQDDKNLTIPLIDIIGRIVNQQGEPVPGASVQVKGNSSLGTSTDGNGYFELKGVEASAILLISGVSIENTEVKVNGRTNIGSVEVKIKVGSLDETLVIAYGTTSRRMNTGSVSKVTAEEISRQPVSNPIIAIAGRVPGLMINTTNGLPGSSTAILIRGRQSLGQGTAPYILLDGVPLMLNSGTLTSGLSNTNQNILNTINPADIESIEVLKDAEATSIYGSQGANGVILINTKKGKSGRTEVSLNLIGGIKKVTRSMDLLSTAQYLEMRREAFQNDNVVPTASNAPDLVLWDQERYTDWKKEFIGGTARNSNIQLSVTGGNVSTQFMASGSLFSEIGLFPGEHPFKRGTGRINLNHKTPNNKFRIQMNASFASDYRKSSINDMTSYIFLPPNAPAFKDSSGNLVWIPGLENPYALLLRKFEGGTTSFVAQGEMSYQLFSGFNLRMSAGYNQTVRKDEGTIPISSQSPGSSRFGSYENARGMLEGWVFEPQFNYKRRIRSLNFEMLSGISLHSRKQDNMSVIASEYTNDDFLGNLQAAGRVDVYNSFSQYRYFAMFGRLKAEWKNRYIFSINIRRDGSSRFGPAERFSNFSAFSAGWIFSESDFVKNAFPFLSFGKIRGSFGVTGNDQIGDYQFIDSWTANTNYNYGVGPGFLPTRLFNSALQWERTRKLQAGIELGFFKDRAMLTLDYYHNRSDNQLVNYGLPSTTGFTNILRNLDALIQNSGIELVLNSTQVQTPKFSWTSMFTVSFPKNKLIRYPGLAESSNATSFIIGQSLRIAQRYQLLGVDPTSGNYHFLDIDNNGILQPQNDYVLAGTLDQKYFGGFDNNFRYKGFKLDLFFQFVKQKGNSYIASLSTLPGQLGNQPVEVLSRWQGPDQPGVYQRFTNSNTATQTAFSRFRSSTGAIVDASYARLKNLAVSYEFAGRILPILKAKQFRIYVQGHDLLTFTGYRGADPETQSVTSLPLLKTFAGGIQITF